MRVARLRLWRWIVSDALDLDKIEARLKAVADDLRVRE